VVLTLWLDGVESWKKGRSAEFSKQINKDQTTKRMWDPRDRSLALCSSPAARNIVSPFRRKRSDDCLIGVVFCDVSDEKRRKG
jgi:hypothetical protein